MNKKKILGKTGKTKKVHYRVFSVVAVNVEESRPKFHDSKRGDSLKR